MRDDEMTKRFRALVRDQGDRIYNLALMRSGRRDLAQDVVQETYLRAWRGLARFRGAAELTTWLYRIAINVCHSYLKRESRKETEALMPELNAAPSAEAEFLKEERRNQVRSAIGRLPEIQADVLTLFYLREQRYEEIASILQLPLGTVKSHLHRAKKALRSQLEEIQL